jgi:hypothetical protein
MIAGRSSNGQRDSMHSANSACFLSHTPAPQDADRYWESTPPANQQLINAMLGQHTVQASGISLRCLLPLDYPEAASVPLHCGYLATDMPQPFSHFLF